MVVVSGSNYTTTPEGLHLCVCCDVVDQGMQSTPWGDKHQVQIRWQSNQADPETGKPFLIVNSYTASLDQRANLRQHLEAWRGKKFSREELDGFDLEVLIGVPCQIQVNHKETTRGTIFPDVQAIVPAPAGTVLEIVEYERVKDREGYIPPGQLPSSGGPYEASGSADPDPFAFIPFLIGGALWLQNAASGVSAFLT